MAELAVRASSSKSKKRRAMNFYEYKTVFWEDYIHAKHMQMIDEKLEQVFLFLKTGYGVNRLIINIAPRHGKSRNVVREFGSFVLSQLPNTKIIGASYTFGLSQAHGEAIRERVKDNLYRDLFGLTVSKTSKAMDEWELDGYDGGWKGAGVGGSLTGYGANLFIIDDPYKNREEAESSRQREKIENWYKAVVATRLEKNNGAIILVQTRWHIHDLTGYLINNEKDWHVLSLPVWDENENMLFPEFFSISEMKLLEERIGQYEFSALYLQKPFLVKNKLFDISKFQALDETHFTRIAKDCLIVRFWDLAITVRERSSYTVGLKLAYHRASETYYILDVKRVKVEYTQVEQLIRETLIEDGTDVFCVLEAAKEGIIAHNQLLADNQLRDFNISKTNPVGDKYSRAQPVSARVNGGRVYYRVDEWNVAFFTELNDFPMSKFNDQVDALSGAYKSFDELVTQVWYT